MLSTTFVAMKSNVHQLSKLPFFIAQHLVDEVNVSNISPTDEESQNELLYTGLVNMYTGPGKGSVLPTVRLPFFDMNIPEAADGIRSLMQKQNFNLYFNDERPRMAIFVSKMSHCLYDLLARYRAGEWEVDIPCIVSNHEDLRYVAEQFDIPYYVWSINKDHSNKAEVEAAEMELLKKEGVTSIVLARYMQIISDEMIKAYPNKIINIHHSFLPAFIGAKPYHQAWMRGVKIIGATSHYVTAELDAGPIIEQDVVRISHKDTPESLVLKGRDLEKIVLSRAVTKHIERKILTYHNKTIIFS